MAALNVDVVLVIDASDSMKPCFDGVRKHLNSLVQPLQGNAARVRFGLVALNALREQGQIGYHLKMLGGASWDKFYATQPPTGLFTEKTAEVLQALQGIHLQGNEHTLMALDFALDHPFGAVHNTRRVVVLLSDETIETGVEGLAACQKIPALVEKLNQRRVKLFMALPVSDAAEQLEAANGCEFEAVQGGGGLAGVDFSRLFQQMGKSISVSATQSSGEATYQRALFGQDRWESVNTNGWSTVD